MTALAVSPLSLLNPQQLDQLRQLMIGYLQTANDPITDWNSGATRLTQMQYSALGVNDLLANLFPTMAGETFLDYAAALPVKANPDRWVDIIAEQIFSLTRNPAVLTIQALLLSSDGSAGPFTVDNTFTVRNPLTGNRYYAISFGTLTSGSPNNLTVMVRAEAPNDPSRGILYADGPNTLIELGTPWAGVTASNVPPPFSGVSTVPSPARGLGVVTVSGTPPVLATAWDFQIVDDGQNTIALFRWRANGGPWSAPITMTATFAIPGTTTTTVHFTNDAGGSDPSFRTGDVYSLTAPGTAISTPGTAKETNAQLIVRCFAQWPDLTAIPEDRHVTWAKAAGAGVVRVAVAVDATYPGRLLVTIAGAPGTSPLGSGVVAGVQAFTDQQEGIGEISLVAAATVTTITATNATGGQVTVLASKRDAVQAAANLAWSTYVNGTTIGGIVRRAQLEKILMDAGAIDFSGLLLNGGGNVVLAVNAVAVEADLGSLNWVSI